MKTRELALGGMLCALAVVILLLGSVLEITVLCGPLLAILILLPVRETGGNRAGWSAWAVVSLLSLLLLPNRESGLVYLCFGWYPMAQRAVAKLPRLLRTLCCVGICTGVILLLYGVIFRLMGLPGDWQQDPKWLTAALVLMANVTFVLLDRAVEIWARRWPMLREKLWKNAPF